jgi:hypothetical protein
MNTKLLIATIIICLLHEISGIEKGKPGGRPLMRTKEAQTSISESLIHIFPTLMMFVIAKLLISKLGNIFLFYRLPEVTPSINK